MSHHSTGLAQLLDLIRLRTLTPARSERLEWLDGEPAMPSAGETVKDAIRPARPVRWIRI